MYSFSENFLAVFHSGFTIYIPTETVGGFPFLYILCSIILCRSFWWWPLWPVWGDTNCSFDWHWFNNYWCGVSFHVLLIFYALWVQFASWNWLPETWPCLEFFSDDLSQDISWGQVSFKTPLDLWPLGALQHLFNGFPAGSMVKNLPAMQETSRRYGFNPWVRRIPWSRKW